MGYFFVFYIFPSHFSILKPSFLFICVWWGGCVSMYVSNLVLSEEVSLEEQPGRKMNFPGACLWH